MAEMAMMTGGTVVFRWLHFTLSIVSTTVSGSLGRSRQVREGKQCHKAATKHKFDLAYVYGH